MEIRDLLNLIVRNLILIIIIILVFMILGALFTSLFIVPKYEANATLIVNKSSAQSESKEYSYNDILLTQKLVNTYSVIIMSDSVLNQVITNIGLDLDSKDLRKNLSVSGINDTEIIRIVVTDTIPERAANVANEITRVAPSEIVRTAKAGSVELIDYAIVPDGPVSPNITQNIFISGFLGFAFIMLILIVRRFIDKTLKSTEEVEALLGIPVIGQIPKF